MDELGTQVSDPIMPQSSRFFLRFAVLYALVLAPWPGWRESYGDYFRALGNLVYGHHGGNWTSYLEPCLRTKGFASMDSQIVLYDNRAIDGNGNVRTSYLGIDSRSIGWLPTGLALALILALSLRVKRLIIAMVLAFLAMQTYVLAVLGIYLFNRAPEAGIIAVPPWIAAASDALEWTFVTQIGPGFVVPVLIALGVVLIVGGKESLSSLIRRSGD
jgi:hypothetical protein